MGGAVRSARLGDLEERETQACRSGSRESNPHDGPVQLEGDGGAPGTVLGIQVELDGGWGVRVPCPETSSENSRIDHSVKLKCLVRIEGRA